MATNALCKINRMSREQISKEMTEWENKKELHNLRYIQLKIMSSLFAIPE